MKKGHLSQYFAGVACKRLSAVEINSLRSNQHEINGVSSLRDLLGSPLEKRRYDAKFVSFNEEEPVTDDGFMTWYDARQKAREERNVRRSEYRLYFSPNVAIDNANDGDLLVIAKSLSEKLIMMVAPQGTTTENQLIWLFDFDAPERNTYQIKLTEEIKANEIDLTARMILEEIGIEIKVESTDYLEQMLEKFHGEFPATAVFSSWSRSTLPDVSSRDDPDAALFAWLEREELLFRTYERHIVGGKLAPYVKKQVLEIDPYLDISMSTFNRRKSRVGNALENHLSKLFEDHNITYSRTRKSEGNRRPDFVFPNIDSYHSKDFPRNLLTMLGAKYSCKDRWRQILNEVKEIKKKHLLTFEPGISENQTAEMQEENVQLILPRELHKSYKPKQQSWIMDVSGFLSLVMERQKSKT